MWWMETRSVLGRTMRELEKWRVGLDKSRFCELRHSKRKTFFGSARLLSCREPAVLVDHFVEVSSWLGGSRSEGRSGVSLRIRKRLRAVTDAVDELDGFHDRYPNKPRPRR